jgi:hypothetical protein
MTDASFVKIRVRANGCWTDWFTYEFEDFIFFDALDIFEPATTLMLVVPDILPDGLNMDYITSLLILGPLTSTNFTLENRNGNISSLLSVSHKVPTSLNRLAFMGFRIDHDVRDFFQ